MLRFARRIPGSLTLRLSVLVVIFIALPVVLYGQFESADRQTRELVTRSIQYGSWLTAQALSPLLDRPEGPPHATLNDELAKYSGDGTVLKLMFQPKGQGERGFYYVASAPKVEVGQLGAELDSLTKHGILSRLAQSCSLDQTTEIRYTRPNGSEEVLTSVIPIRSRWGCWVLVSSHVTSEFLETSIGRPYWETREVRIAASIYLIVALLAALIAMSVWRSMRHFRNVARDIRKGEETGFADRNLIPELSSVAQDFDGLVNSLHEIARDIRQTAEDNAHSFKAPVATIQSSVASLKRMVPEDNPRAVRAVALIESSLSRLRALITASQRIDNNTADLIETPRQRVNLTRVVAGTLLRARDVLGSREISLVRRLEEDVTVEAGKGSLDVVVENILDNAISFTPPGGVIMVTLSQSKGGQSKGGQSKGGQSKQEVDLTIEDSGPGIEAEKIDRIFERYFSLRPQAREECADPLGPPAPSHAGLGLWIVRRNVEALGGRVTASNRVGGGLCVHVTLPAG